MAKWHRKTLYEVIDKNRSWSAQGCNTYSLRNIGNVNVTINKTDVLKPGECWEGAEENPEVIDWSDIDIEFDLASTPTTKAPAGGVFPDNAVVVPGSPAPSRDTRLIIYKSFITPA